MSENRLLDITDIIDGYDSSVVDFVKDLKNFSYRETREYHNDNCMFLHSMDEESYVDMLLNILLEGSFNPNDKIKKKSCFVVNLKEVLAVSNLTNELTKIILEKLLFYCLSVNTFHLDFYLNGVQFRDGSAEDVRYPYAMVEELIDSGSISGSDIACFIDRDEIVKYIYNTLLINSSKIIESTMIGLQIEYKENMICPLGWVGDNLYFMEAEILEDNTNK